MLSPSGFVNGEGLLSMMALCPAARIVRADHTLRELHRRQDDVLQQHLAARRAQVRLSGTRKCKRMLASSIFLKCVTKPVTYCNRGNVALCPSASLR